MIPNLCRHCRRPLPEREPGRGGQPQKYCPDRACKQLAYEQRKASTVAPAGEAADKDRLGVNRRDTYTLLGVNTVPRHTVMPDGELVAAGGNLVPAHKLPGSRPENAIYPETIVSGADDDPSEGSPESGSSGDDLGESDVLTRNEPKGRARDRNNGLPFGRYTLDLAAHLRELDSKGRGYTLTTATLVVDRREDADPFRWPRPRRAVR